MRNVAKYLAHERLRPGYAETSTRRYPARPEVVVLPSEVVASARCVGAAYINGTAGWLAFRVPGSRRFYFQYRPW